VNTSFEYNSANYSSEGGGGAVFVSTSGQVQFESGCVFTGNTALGERGGAVYQAYPHSASYSPSISFEDNYARYGGAIWVELESPGNNSWLNLSNISFKNNSVSVIDLFKSCQHFVDDLHLR